MASKQKDLEAYRDRIWAARKHEMIRTEEHQTEAKRLYAEAAAFARDKGLDADACIADAALLSIGGDRDAAIALLEQTLEAGNVSLPGLACLCLGSLHGAAKQFDVAIECYQKALDDPNYDKPGNAWTNMGIAFADMGEHDRAIECCEKAMDDPSYGTRGNAWNNMGISLWRKGEYDRAIECCKKALDDPKYDRPGNAWSTMGLVFAGKGEYDRAIECLEKALDAPNFDMPERAWIVMGFDFVDKGEHDRAIECYEKALATPDSDLQGHAWLGMGGAFLRRRDYVRAIECFQKALAAFEEAGQPELAATAQSLIDSLRLEPGQRSERDQALLEAPAAPSVAGDGGVSKSARERLRNKLAFEEEDAYTKYAEGNGSELDDVLAILKGWGSAVPLIQETKNASTGGGCFLKWRGKGMVVDPGLHFLQNFHRAGFRAQEVDAVVVSHHHMDHMQDLQPLDLLFYELHKRASDEKRPDWRYAPVWDADTNHAQPFEIKDADYRYLPLAFDINRWKLAKAKKPLIDLADTAELPFRIRYFPVVHGGKEIEHPVGFRVECLSEDGETAVTVGFSCDTEFFDELTDKDHLGGSDILVLHISQPRVEELDRPDDPGAKKRGHLGYGGVEKVVKGVEPKLAIVSEFWGGLTDMRMLIVEALRQDCGMKSILPGSVGMLMNPRDWTVQCTACKEWCAYDRILVLGPERPFGPLQYLCRECLL